MHQTNANGVALNKVGAPPRPKSPAEVFFRVLCCFSGAEAAGQAASNRLKGPLLPPSLPEDKEKKYADPLLLGDFVSAAQCVTNPPSFCFRCLVLDLDETLVHSSFKPIPNPDYVIPVEIEGQIHHVYVLKRPGVDAFLERAGAYFEIVVFTASLAKWVLLLFLVYLGAMRS